MAKVIVIMNRKGGVGKTTTTINLAGGLCYMKARVLTLDIDRQRQLTKYSRCQSGNTLLDILNNNATFDQTVQHVSYGDILPGSAEIDEFKHSLTERKTALYRIRDILEPIRDRYDYILIDCPANNQLTTAALVAADSVIVPTQPEFFAVDGVSLMLTELTNKAKTENPNLKIEGVLVVKYKEHLKLHRLMLQILKSLSEDMFNVKVFEAKIRDTVAIPTSQMDGRNIFEYDPKCAAAQDFLMLIKELFVVQAA